MEQAVERTRTRKRATRPDGSFYSSSPKERHAQLVEDGKIGAKGSELARQQGALGGRPKQPRPAELLAEKAREKAQDLWQVYEDAIHPDQPIRIRLEGANSVHKLVRDEEALQLDENKFENKSKEDLIEELLSLSSNPLLKAALNPNPAPTVAPGDGFEHETESWDG